MRVLVLQPTTAVPQDAQARVTAGHTPIEFKPSSNGAATEATELQKKQARAKRFGVPLSEAEQKAMRAERCDAALCNLIPDSPLANDILS